MNAFLLFFLLVLFVEIAVCTSLKYVASASQTIGELLSDCRLFTNGNFFFLSNSAGGWYMGSWTVKVAPGAQEVLQDVFSFLIVFNYIIPISLYVTLGIVDIIILHSSSLLNIFWLCVQRCRSSLAASSFRGTKSCVVL